METPGEDFTVPIRIDWDLKRERRRAEDRLRKMTPEELFKALRLLKELDE